MESGRRRGWRPLPACSMCTPLPSHHRNPCPDLSWCHPSVPAMDMAHTPAPTLLPGTAKRPSLSICGWLQDRTVPDKRAGALSKYLPYQLPDLASRAVGSSRLAPGLRSTSLRVFLPLHAVPRPQGRSTPALMLHLGPCTGPAVFPLYPRHLLSSSIKPHLKNFF